LFCAEEAPALALHIVAVQLTNPFRELVAFEALNAGVVEPASLHIFHKALQVFGVVIAIRAIPATHYQKTAICLAVIHPAEVLWGVDMDFFRHAGFLAAIAADFEGGGYLFWIDPGLDPEVC
jgi:hypothetical protein